MKAGWREVKLGEVIAKIGDHRGRTPPKLTKGKYRVLSAKNIKTGRIVSEDSVGYFDDELYEKYVRLELLRGDIIITSEAPFGEVYYWNTDEKAALSQRLFSVRMSEDVDSRYAYYYMISGDFQHEMAARASGTTVQGLRQPELLNCKFAYPPLAIQQRIAAVLGALDDKIELNRKMNANLEAQAQALFKSWFVDFEPFGGQMPNGWKKGRLDEIAEYNCGRISANELTILNFITTENMTADRGGVSAAASLPIIDQVPLFDRGDVLISNIRPYFKKIWRADCRGGRSADVLCLKAKAPILQFYLYRLLWDDAFFAYVMQSAKGTKMPRGDKLHILEYGCVVPTTEVLAKFNKMLCPICELIEKNVAESRKLAETRDALLPKLMKGEIEV